MADPTLLLSADTPLTCPGCGHVFSLATGFAQQALEGAQSASRQALALLRAEERSAAEEQARTLATQSVQAAEQRVLAAQQVLKSQEAAHERALADVRRLTEEAVAPQIALLRQQLADSNARLAGLDEREAALQQREHAIGARVLALAAEKARELFEAERLAYEQRLSEASGQMQVLRTEQVTLRTERLRWADEKAALQLDMTRQLEERLREREANARAQEQAAAALEKAELRKKLDDVTHQLTEAQRTAEQGSQQLQGEVLELAIEEGLRRAFPLDTIEEVKKGARGADVLQRVCSRSGQVAGLLLWESKRAKDWSGQWTTKLREDMRAISADVGVLVTMPGATPREWSPGQLFGLVDGVWVVLWAPALQLAQVLRSALLDLHKQRVSSTGKGEKMEALYDYLTSAQFAQKLKAVYETFRSLKDENDRERAAAEQRWARRDRHLQTGMRELMGFAGDVQGLAQAAPLLELENEALPQAPDQSGVA